MVTVDEAREKYGSEDKDGCWNPDKNKVRGMIQSFARAREKIEGETEEPQASEYIDELWEWLQEKLGPGFEAVFQGQSMSPSGKFDRIGKDKLENIADRFYENNSKFSGIVDDKWEHSPDVDDVVTELENMSDKGVIEEFRVVKNDEFEYIPNPAEDSDDGAYRKWIKRYALNVEFLGLSGSPNAEEFVDTWIDYMIENVVRTRKSIVRPDNDDMNSMFDQPTYSEVVQMVRDMWASDSEFRENVKEKWQKDEDENDDGTGFDEVERPGTRQSNKKGQVKIGDYGNG